MIASIVPRRSAMVAAVFFKVAAVVAVLVVAWG
jgi:hypothetical protein